MICTRNPKRDGFARNHIHAIDSANLCTAVQFGRFPTRLRYHSATVGCVLHGTDDRSAPQLTGDDMCEAPQRARRAGIRTTSLRLAWLLCIALIVFVPGLFALMVGTTLLEAVLITAFTLACVWMAGLLINFR